MNRMLTKTYVAGAAIAAHRIVAFGASDDEVVQASAATDALIGVAAELPVPAEARVDVHHVGIVEIEFGGNVARGALVTANANGQAVAAAPAAGANAAVIGRALVSAVNGDIAPVLLAPGQVQG